MQLHGPDDGYYENVRPEVAALVPDDARHVVDVGCGAGALGRALKAARPQLQVRGVEVVPEQANRARAVLEDVFVGTAEQDLPAHWPAPDCVIFADVLEHLVDPWQTLRRYREQIAPGGCCVASIPNVANWRVLYGLLRHRWDYAEHGILDRSHLRFFTRETAVELFEQSGYTVRHVRRVVEKIGRQGVARSLYDALDREHGRERRYPAPLAHLLDAVTFQFLIVASAE